MFAINTVITAVKESGCKDGIIKYDTPYPTKLIKNTKKRNTYLDKTMSLLVIGVRVKYAVPLYLCSINPSLPRDIKKQ